MMYSVAAYGQMLADTRRLAAYSSALEAAITPGCTVLEIGCGPGVFAVHAARLGAGHVFAIEPDDVIALGPPLAARHDVGDRVTFLQTTSQLFEPSKPVDLVFSDLRGILPLFQTHLPSVIDARERLLAPEGVLLPRKDTLRAAAVTAEDAFEQRAGIWNQGPMGLDLSAGWELEQNRPSKVVLPASACLTASEFLAELDYKTISGPNVEARVTLRVNRAGTVHGVLVWFDTKLFHEIGFSCAPGDGGLIYGQMFFPFPEPVALVAGADITFRLDGHLAYGDYVWRWRVAIRSMGDEIRKFDQGSFWAAPLSIAAMRRRATDHRPTLSDSGAMKAFVLERMDGDQTLETIAGALYLRFEAQFEDQQAAFDQVCAWSVRYGV